MYVFMYMLNILSTNLYIVQEIDVLNKVRNMNNIPTTPNKKTMISREAFIAGIMALFIAM